MNRFEVDPAENPFVDLKVRRLALLLLVISMLLAVAQVGLANTLQVSIGDPIWTWLMYIVLMVSVCVLMLLEFDRLRIQLEDVVGRLDRPNWLRLAGLVLAVLVSSLGWFYLSFYLISLAAPQAVNVLLEQVNLTDDVESAFPLLNAVLQPLVLVVVAPITEEFLFRGIILQRWATKWGIRPALIASSIVFGILHANFVGLSIFGLVMGLLYLKTRSLVVPIAAHALNNGLVALSLLMPASNDSAEALSLETLQQNWWMGLVMVAISAPFLVRFIAKNYPRRDALVPYFVNRSHRLN